MTDQLIATLVGDATLVVITIVTAKTNQTANATHTIVNSQRTAMETKIDGLREQAQADAATIGQQQALHDAGSIIPPPHNSGR
jgi:outer membrane murein-binding lipoprotein Lpp